MILLGDGKKEATQVRKRSEAVFRLKELNPKDKA